MILALGIIIFIVGCCLSSYEDVSYENQKQSERRHRELMRELEECRKENEAKKLVPPNCGTNVMPRQERRARRRMVKDKDGNILAEEITEEIING